MNGLSDGILTLILNEVGTRRPFEYILALCDKGCICAAQVRLVSKRWRRIIALHVAATTSVSMTIHESWYFGNQATMEFIGAHPFTCRAHKQECLRIPDKAQAPEHGRAVVPMTTVDNPTHYMWVHADFPSMSPKYSGGGLQMAAFDTGYRLVHIGRHSTSFRCERDASKWRKDGGIYPPPASTRPPASQTCLALQIGLQMSPGNVMSFMARPPKDGT